jgi:signal transduction histidine kinase
MLDDLAKGLGRWAVFAAGVGLMAAITALDVVMGPRVSLVTFHWAPIAFVTWVGGVFAGYASVAVSLLMAVVRDSSEGRSADFVSIVWDVAARGISFAFFVWILGRLRGAYDKEAEKRRESQKTARLKTSKLLLMRHEVANAVTMLKMWTFLNKDSAGEGIDDSWLAVSRLLKEMESTAAEAEPEGVIVKLERLDLGGLLDELVEIYRPLCAQKSLTVVLDAPRGGLFVWGDRASVALIVSNLLSNAVKYTPRGGRVTITAGERLEAPGRARVSLKDSGPGMSANDLRGLAAALRAPKGNPVHEELGAGLKTVRDLLSAHNSWLDVEAKSGAGCSFAFDLTVCSGASPAERPIESRSLPEREQRR